MAQIVLPTDTVQGLQQLAPGQCVLVTSKPAFQTISGNKWFQNLHISIVPDADQNSDALQVLSSLESCVHAPTGMYNTVSSLKTQFVRCHRRICGHRLWWAPKHASSLFE